MFHLGLDRGLEFFSKESNEVGLFWSPVSIKLDNRLKMLEVRRPIVNFFLRILGVSLNPDPTIVYERPGVSMTLSKKNF